MMMTSIAMGASLSPGSQHPKLSQAYCGSSVGLMGITENNAFVPRNKSKGLEALVAMGAPLLQHVFNPLQPPLLLCKQGDQRDHFLFPQKVYLVVE